VALSANSFNFVLAIDVNRMTVRQVRMAQPRLAVGRELSKGNITFCRQTDWQVSPKPALPFVK